MKALVILTLVFSICITTSAEEIFAQCQDANSKTYLKIYSDGKNKKAYFDFKNDGNNFVKMPLESKFEEYIDYVESNQSYYFTTRQDENLMVKISFNDKDYIKYALEKGGTKDQIPQDYLGSVAKVFIYTKELRYYGLESSLNCKYDLAKVLKLPTKNNYIKHSRVLTVNSKINYLDSKTLRESYAIANDNRSFPQGPLGGPTYDQPRINQRYNREPVVVLHTSNGYGSKYDEYVPASQAPYGSEPVVAITVTDGYGQRSVEYVPASKAPYGSVPVVASSVTDSYGHTSVEFNPIYGEPERNYCRNCPN